MKSQDEALLNRAIESVRDDEPSTEQLTASAAKVAGRLGLAFDQEQAVAAIRSCSDIQPLLSGYRAGTLPVPRAMLVEAHLRECGVCLRISRSGSPAVDWSAPRMAASRTRIHPRVWGWALATSFALLVTGVFLYKAYWQVPPGVRAEVQSIDGSASLITGSGDRLIAAGAQLTDGEEMRTSGGSHAVLRLSDGSTMELNERSLVRVTARGRNMTVALDHGAAIVKASPRSSGHLYLQTTDCRVAVTGTVFSVNAGIKGSSVAVLQGTVHVDHAGSHSLLHAGEQMTTSANMTSTTVADQIAWSQNRDQYIQLLAQLSMLQHRIERIPMPLPRYSSDLLNRVPADTLLYVSVPNLGDFVTEANVIFQDQLKQSPALQQWWNRGSENKTDELDSLVNKIHDLSRYIGDEVVIVGLQHQPGPAFAILADVERGGLTDLLRQEFAASAHGTLTVIEEGQLNTAVGPVAKNTAYALVRGREVVFSNSIETLKAVDAQLNAGSSGFATTDFGRQIAAAYDRGAGIILAANLHQMLSEAGSHGNKKSASMLQNSGISGVQYLIAEHREADGIPQNHLNLQFAGARQRVASWLGAPAPVGSLDFVTPNAAFAVAGLSKDPAEIADDIVAMLASDQKGMAGLQNAQSDLQVDLRNDLAANLGGEFLFALDGPVLPTPSWKIVAEVRDSGRLESTLERLVKAVDNRIHDPKAHAVAIEPSQAEAQAYYAVRDLKSGEVVAQYTYAGGYMVIAPNRALLMEALRARATGDSLSHSSSFRAQLPRDGNENYSAVAYQNLSPVLTPLLSTLGGDTADAVRKLAADSRPTAICAWGQDAGIELASNSRLFGFDFLSLRTLLAFEHGSQAKGTEQNH